MVSKGVMLVPRSPAHSPQSTNIRTKPPYAYKLNGLCLVHLVARGSAPLYTYTPGAFACNTPAADVYRRLDKYMLLSHK